MDRDGIGPLGERLAAEHLKKNGYKILKRNYTCVVGEIDIVAFEDRQLVFVEVKALSAGLPGDPEEHVDAHKRAKVAEVARQYRREKRVNRLPYRFDVVSVVIADGQAQEIRLFRNAFRG